jgi:hypothetical protein
MKKTLLTLALVCATVAAFGQGKVALQNNSVSAIAVGLSGIPSADLGLAGLPIPTTGPLPSGPMIYVGLYAGTASGALSLVSGEIVNPVGGTGNAAGVLPILHILLPFAGGTLAYYEVKAWDSTYANYDTAYAAGAYSGHNNEFTMTAGTSIAYVAINGGGGSTWTTVGNDSYLYVQPVPEPTTLALVGLGAASLLIFRRRK